MSEKLQTLAAVVLLVSSVSFTISVTSMFKWLREIVSKFHHKLEELIHCPYCLGHWITFAAVIFLDIPLVEFVKTENSTIGSVLNGLLTAFSVMGGVAVVHFVMLRAYEPVAKLMAQRAIDKIRGN